MCEQITLQPSPDDLKKGITFEEARIKEDTFFKTQEPWNELDAVHKRRMGTNNLAQHLSEFLFTMIKKECAAFANLKRD